jgi:hypothetical protein
MMAATAPPAGGSGLFQERASAEATPTIHVYNEEEGTLILTLTDQHGVRYETRVTTDRPGILKVPPGHYSVYVTSDVPGISPNEGDADFREFKQYDAAFVYSQDAERIHLGD